MTDKILVDREVIKKAAVWIHYARRKLNIERPAEERDLLAALAQAEIDQDIPTIVGGGND